MNFSTRCILATIVGVALAGCGGGGGGGDGDSASKAYPGPNDEVAIKNEDGAVKLAMDVQATLDSFSFGMRASSLGGPTSIFEIGDYFENSAPLRKAVAKAETRECPGGGTYTYDVEGDGAKGSYATYSYDDCVVDGVTYSGSDRMVVINGDYSTPNYTVTRTINHYRMETASGDYFAIHGEFTQAKADDGSGTTSDLMSGPGLYYGLHMGEPAIDVLYTDFAFAQSEDSAGNTTFSQDVSISSSLIGGTVVMHTTTPFETPAVNSNPQAGRIVVTAADSDRVKFTADGAARADEDHVTIEWDLDGLEGYEGKKETYWYSDWSL